MIRYHKNSLKSKYKNLVVSGCSFTHNEHSSHVTWGNTLAYWTGMTISNHAVNGAGNGHIADSIILFLEKNKPNPDDTLIIVMWSTLYRVDWITDRKIKKDFDHAKHTYHYDSHNELSGLMLHNKEKSHFLDTGNNYRKYQSEYSYALKNWLAMESLSNYLTAHGYQYLYTSIYDLNRNNHGLYNKILAEIDLTIDQSSWLELDSDNYLGAFAKNKNMVAEDKWHPTPECQEIWTQDILIPMLQKKQIINNEPIQI